MTGAKPLIPTELEKLRHVLRTAQRGDYLDNAFCWHDIEQMFATISELQTALATAQGERDEARADRDRARDTHGNYVLRSVFDDAVETERLALARADRADAAITAFLAKWEQVKPWLDGASVQMHIRGMGYQGPTLESELKGLRDSVASKGADNG